MEHLPDDVLLMVMELLEVADLLACRRVCKRIGALALHREAWRHREVDDHDHVSHVLCPVLRLAPCVDTLVLTLPFMSDGCLPPFTSTRCAVRHLALVVEPGSAMFAAFVLRNQEALGRLKRITLRFSPEDEDAELLMETLASTTGLERVVFRHDLFSDIEDAPSRFEPLSRLHKTSAPSLLMFDCEYTRESEELCNFMLAVHAATLEFVNLSGDDDATYNYCSSKSAAALLAGMPNLYELTSFPLPGMADVAACASLRVVHLTVCEESRRTVREAAAFLRRAKQLRQVTLDYGHAGTKSSDIGVDLVLAVNPSVEELVIRSRREAPPDLLPQLQALLIAPALRTLRRLEVQVDAVPDALLLGITADTAPALRNLELGEVLKKDAGEARPEGVKKESEERPCAHHWLHKEAVRRLLQCNPSLELLLTNMCGYSCGKDTCDACAEECELECKRVVFTGDFDSDSEDDTD